MKRAPRKEKGSTVRYGAICLGFTTPEASA
jgi:hypothetical protein